MQAKGKTVEQPTVVDLGLTPDEVGLNGSGQRVVQVRAAPARSAGTKIVDDGEAHLAIVEALERAKVI
jgi:electron transfer flavoprotein beta subunit